MESEKVQELVPPGQPLPETEHPDMPTAPVPTESPVKCGYFIGMRENGEFVFDIIGTAPGLVELLGLHAIVKERLSGRMDSQLGGKFSLVIQKLDYIAKQLVVPNDLWEEYPTK